MTKMFTVLAILVLMLMPVTTSASRQSTPAVDGNGTSRETPIATGEVGRVGDYDLKVVEVIPDATELVLAENPFNKPPEQGNIFVIARVEVTYTGQETGLAADLFFSVVGDKNRGYSEHKEHCGTIPDDAFESPELFQGGTTAFNVCWSVPEEEAGSLVMYVEQGFSGQRVWFGLEGAPSPDTEARTESHGAPAAQDGRDQVTLEAGDLFFQVVDPNAAQDGPVAWEPAIFEIAPGGTITLTNVGFLPHDFTVDALGIQGAAAPNSDSVTITIPDDAKPGEYEFYCSIPGHKEAGMVGTLIVVDENAAHAPEHVEGTPSASQSEESSGEPVTIIAMDYLEFEPAELEVSPGQTVIVQNDGFLQHDLVIDAWGGQMVPLLNNGESAEFTIPADAVPGESFEFYCSVPGHREGGMVGVFTIVAPDASGHEEVLAPTEEARVEDGDGTGETVTIEAGELYFEPDALKVAPGDTIVLTNMGALDHDFAVDEWGGVIIGPLEAGQSGEYTVPENVQPGETFTFYCSIPGHREAGMEGTLTIEAYEVTDLGTLGGSFSIAYDVNEARQVVGESTTAPGQGPDAPGSHAFLWSDGEMIDLGTLGGETSSAIDINNAGQVVGTSETAAGAVHATLWQDGEVIDLGTLGGDHSSAIRINDAGQVVGYSTTAPGQELLDPGTHAFLWENGEMTDLGTLGGDVSSVQDINEADQVVGTSETANGAIHPFLWENGEMTDLGTIPGFGGGRAFRINDHGWVVGVAVDPLGDVQATPVAGQPLERHAWLYRDGDLLDLGTLGGTNSSALGLNNHGQVVGYSEIAVDTTSGAGVSPVASEESPPPPHAFIWQDGEMTDLNDLASGEELLLEGALAINDNGQITGGAIFGDEYHGFLLTPLQGQ